MPRMTYAARPCQECGAHFVPKRAHAKFCSKACGHAWQNRAARRGSDIYHLIMASRFDRAHARELGVMTTISRLCAMYRHEDEMRRDGRQSWDDPKEVKSRNVQASAVYMPRLKMKG